MSSQQEPEKLLTGSSSKTSDKIPAHKCRKCGSALFVLVGQWRIRCANCGSMQQMNWYETDDGR